ncbi:MAG TPA: 6,7-dimethyl-8-ribityllumazine synthase [Candidatus Binataceae bacterium]
MKIAIAVSDFNLDVTSRMLERACEHAKELGLEVSHIVHVPGVYDFPLVVKALLKREDVEGVAILGAVIKGQTMHDEVIVHSTANVVAELAVEFNKPVALGVTGPGMDRIQALQRIDNAKHAVGCVAQLIKTTKALAE